MVIWTERETRSVENEEYLGDSPSFSLFPSFSKIVIFYFLKLTYIYIFKGECKGDEGGHRYGRGMMM